MSNYFLFLTIVNNINSSGLFDLKYFFTIKMYKMFKLKKY